MSKAKVKESIEFANKAFDSLESQFKYIKELEDKVEHLENLLKNSDIQTIEPKSPLSRKAHEIEIIEIEFKRLHEKVVTKNQFLDKDDLKKFEILVKAIVALKGGQPKDLKPKKKEKETTIEDLLKTVMSNSDEEESDGTERS